jgi:hypothetical protein
MQVERDLTLPCALERMWPPSREFANGLCCRKVGQPRAQLSCTCSAEPLRLKAFAFAQLLQVIISEEYNQ